ncbi:hypothetical protein BJ508DRAFT_337723 [Ascobolus immersus RN42]|uniref:Uncharacterized protein n=1 Tax=Ascobolus immersus RN42 TaxID=1160509 RepID=A0A3N4IGY8_ASCIM|nr:hypothetical protein BJ508DRAFT_337723 [Ascobolus immersus RN42]
MGFGDLLRNLHHPNDRSLRSSPRKNSKYVRGLNFPMPPPPANSRGVGHTWHNRYSFPPSHSLNFEPHYGASYPQHSLPSVWPVESADFYQSYRPQEGYVQVGGHVQGISVDDYRGGKYQRVNHADPYGIGGEYHMGGGSRRRKSRRYARNEDEVSDYSRSSRSGYSSSRSSVEWAFVPQGRYEPENFTLNQQPGWGMGYAGCGQSARSASGGEIRYFHKWLSLEAVERTLYHISVVGSTFDRKKPLDLPTK